MALNKRQRTTDNIEVSRSWVESTQAKLRSHDALVAALKRLVVAFDIGRDIYWHKLNLPRPADDDTEPIKDARAALASIESTDSQPEQV